MATPDDYTKRIEGILRRNLATKGNLRKGIKLKLEINNDTIPEARQLLASVRQSQKEIRQVKREVNAEMKTIRAVYKEKASRVQPGTSSLIASAFSLGLRKGARKGGLRQSVADQKRKLREERDRVLAPYESLKLSIDNILLQLDKGKLAIDAWITKNK